MNAIFTFGRFNPPTYGHFQLFEFMNALKKPGDDIFIFTSKTNNEKNILTIDEKMEILITYSNLVNYFSMNNIEDVLEMFTNLNYKKLTFVLGEDRKNFAKSFSEYICKNTNIICDYKILKRNKYSSTKLKEMVINNDRENFDKCVFPTIKNTDNLWNILQCRLETLHHNLL